MTDVVLAAVLGVLGGIVLTVLLLLARRLARGAADLGSDAEQAALDALHHASLAAPHLRAGLAAPAVVKAARHLRVLLGSAAVAIVSADGTVSFDGPSDGLESAAVRIAGQVTASGRRQVFPSPGADDDLEAVGAPILVEGRAVGAVVAFAAPVRAALVRAAEEVADWCAAQVELGDLEASRTQLAEAELRSLRAQISPHFIYNALTAIASFILSDPARARELVLEFADFTRYSFRRQGEFTTLAEELGSIHSYLELESARFGDRLKVTLQIAPETLATVIPSSRCSRWSRTPSGTGWSRERAEERSASRLVTTARTPRSRWRTTASAWTRRDCAPRSPPPMTVCTSDSETSTRASVSSTGLRAD